VLNFTSAGDFTALLKHGGAASAGMCRMWQNISLPRSIALAGVMAASLFLNSGSAQTTQNPPQPDNTKVNKRDRAAGAVTADQQKENKTDRALAQQIRKAVMADKSLSTYAHNVKIVGEGGNVVLKGPVRSDEEKKAIVAKAEEIAGAGKVTDQLSVKAAQ
jgi:hyperosmotically inducible protein